MREARNGIVISIEGDCADVMTPEGEIFRVDPAQWGRRPALGEEVLFLPAARPGRLPASVGRRLLAALVPLAAAAAVGLAMVRPLSLAPAVATVAVDINPSLELDVTAREVVRAARGVNGDGEALLGQVEVTGRRLDDAVAEIAAQAVRSGRLRRGGVFAATIVPLRSGVSAAQLGRLARDGASRGIRAAGGTASLVIASASRDLLQEAHASGTPLGKYLAGKAARRAGVPLPAGALADAPLGSVLGAAGLTWKEVFPGLMEALEIGLAPPGGGPSPGDRRSAGGVNGPAGGKAAAAAPEPPPGPSLSVPGWPGLPDLPATGLPGEGLGVYAPSLPGGIPQVPVPRGLLEPQAGERR